MTMKYYARVWVRDNAVYTVNAMQGPITFDTFTGWADEIIDLEIAGEYEDAGILLAAMSYGQNGLLVAGRNATVTATRAGNPRDVEAELLELRSHLKLTFAQLLIGLVTEGWITQAEGTAWLINRMPPAPVTALINQLPAAEQFTALARVVQPSEVLRLDPLVVSLGAAQGKTPAEVDQFFITYKDM